MLEYVKIDLAMRPGPSQGPAAEVTALHSAALSGFGDMVEVAPERIPALQCAPG